MSRFNKVEVPKEFILSEEVEMHQLTTEGVGMAPLLASKVSFKVKMKYSLERSKEIRPKVVYDQNLVSVSATETKIKFRYRFRGQNFFCLNLNFPPF